MPFNMENKEKYYLIARIWELLSVCKYPKRALISFVLRFLKLSGYSFFDYLKSDGIFINKNIKNTIRKLSNCSGNDLDLFEDIEENKILNYIEVYITNYISRPSLCIFLKKITKSQIYIDL
jgi:DNA repair protein RecO (recombination protein O)